MQELDYLCWLTLETKYTTKYISTVPTCISKQVLCICLLVLAVVLNRTSPHQLLNLSGKSCY